MPAIENVMNMIGLAAALLKARLDMIYSTKIDSYGRRFSGLHETVLPMCSAARSIFQQLRNSDSKKSKKKKSDDTPHKINGKVGGRITGVDMRHLMLLLQFLLFELLYDEITSFNTRNHTFHVGPAQKLIAFVLVFLEWYRLYRSFCCIPLENM
jgi:hypothetical protein